MSTMIDAIENKIKVRTKNNSRSNNNATFAREF